MVLLAFDDFSASQTLRVLKARLRTTGTAGGRAWTLKLRKPKTCRTAATIQRWTGARGCAGFVAPPKGAIRLVANPGYTDD